MEAAEAEPSAGQAPQPLLAALGRIPECLHPQPFSSTTPDDCRGCFARSPFPSSSSFPAPLDTPKDGPAPEGSPGALRPHAQRPADVRGVRANGPGVSA